ncbi:hypothetical protein [Larsenimonas salina]|uniref:hypothetical protein n=1 Tax=Larsenimonas salina TaxID=1295565 RepID=UPI002073C56C|nr:hypothetical protein [Larsenimonas salina]MCM5705035.1 hypothetical protein [Larsenimonas salina]
MIKRSGTHYPRAYFDTVAAFVQQVTKQVPSELVVSQDTSRSCMTPLKLYFIDEHEARISLLGVLRFDPERMAGHGALPLQPGRYPVPEGMYRYLIQVITQRLAWNQHSDHGFATEWLTHGLWDTLACRIENSNQLTDYTPSFSDSAFPYLARVTFNGQPYRFQILGRQHDYLVGRPFREYHVDSGNLPDTFPGREWLAENSVLNHRLMFMSDCAYLLPEPCVDQPAPWFEPESMTPPEQACQMLAQVVGLSSYLSDDQTGALATSEQATRSSILPALGGAAVVAGLAVLTVIMCL